MNAFLFPGQGSQAISMGSELYSGLSAAKSLLDNANDILGYDLKKIMFNGPIEKLTETQYAQPAIYTCSAMYLEKARAQDITYKYTMGHSLGEYSALYASGAISFEDGLKLVNSRGKAMASQNGKGSMAAILGLTEDEMMAYLNDSVVMANLNSKTQIVISGTNEGINAVEDVLKSRIESGGIKFKRLTVSAAFHSPQMREAAEIMKLEIEKAKISEPKCYLISNVTGRPTRDMNEIKTNLINQITGQVRWYDSINAAISANVDCFYECGYGQVLRKLNRTIALKPHCYSI